MVSPGYHLTCARPLTAALALFTLRRRAATGPPGSGAWRRRRGRRACVVRRHGRRLQSPPRSGTGLNACPRLVHGLRCYLARKRRIVGGRRYAAELPNAWNPNGIPPAASVAADGALLRGGAGYR